MQKYIDTYNMLTYLKYDLKKYDLKFHFCFAFI